MDIKDYLEKHNSIKLKVKDAEETLKIAKEELQNFIKQNLDLNFLSTLPYEEFKVVYEEIKNDISYSYRDEICKTLEEVKKRDYPQYAKAHYFPMLNNISCLNNDEIKIIDEELCKLSRPAIHSFLINAIMKNIGYNKWEDAEKELIKLNVIEPRYSLTCPHCRETFYSNSISKEQLDMLENNLDNLTEECYEILYETGEYCDECNNDFDIEDKWELKCFVENTKNNGRYKLLVEPDMTYANK